MTYPDTSFLCALYIAQDSSLRAIRHMKGQAEPLISTSLLFFEFRQSVQFQVFRHSKDPRHGYPRHVAQIALMTLQMNATAGVFRQAAVDWAEVHRIAERLAFQHTLSGGHRSFDILHIATALHLGAREFLTFDENQKKLAEAEGLTVPL